jgi:hypothetical protein
MGRQVAAARHVVLPEALRIHLENRPADTEIGWFSFDLDTVKALTRSEGRDDALQTLPLGDYLPIVLAHAGWWMQLADLAAGASSSHSLRARLGVLRSALADVLAAVTPAWAETYLHSRNPVSTAAGRLLLSRYLRLRTKVYALLSAALPGVELEPFAHLV